MDKLSNACTFDDSPGAKKCLCGCGQVTNKSSCKRRKYKKGEYVDYIPGHRSQHNNQGETHPSWKGGKRLTSKGYIYLWVAPNKYEFEHKVIAEKILGKRLPSKAVMHHLNGIRSDNRNKNLVICEGPSYHALLHNRTIAKKESGNAKLKQCKHCKEWDTTIVLYKPYLRVGYHRECYNKYRRFLYKRTRQNENIKAPSPM